MKIVLPDFTDFPDLPTADRQHLADLGATIYTDRVNEEALLDRIRDAELITVSWADIDDRVIRSAPQLKYIVVTAVGYDNVDLSAAAAAGIRVCNCPTHNASAVAEYTIAAIFAVTRRLVAAHQSLKAGQWQTEQFKGVELNGKKLGLIGYGSIGRQVEKLAIGLGMAVSHATSRTSDQELDRLIAAVDILSLHLPLNLHTRHLIDERRLNLMQPSAYLINTARGAIVDQKALFTALQQNRLAGAALDVFEDEPVAGNPNSEIIAFAQLDNVIATPHIAYNTDTMTANLGQELIASIEACIAGTPINQVN